MLIVEDAYACREAQKEFNPALFTQIQTAATRAYRKMPAKDNMSSSLTSIKQGPDEPFSEFVDRLITAANRIFGHALQALILLNS